MSLPALSVDLIDQIDRDNPMPTSARMSRMLNTEDGRFELCRHLAVRSLIESLKSRMKDEDNQHRVLSPPS